MHLLWNSSDVLLVGVVCQYEDHLKFHFFVQFGGLMGNVFLVDFKDG